MCRARKKLVVEQTNFPRVGCFDLDILIIGAVGSSKFVRIDSRESHHTAGEVSLVGLCQFLVSERVHRIIDVFL